MWEMLTKVGLSKQNYIWALWLPYMRGLKPDLALKEKALSQQQWTRWAPYFIDMERLEVERIWRQLGFYGNVICISII